MSETRYGIVESWPMLREDLVSFLRDTDGWVIAELKTAYEARDWDRVNSVIDVMDAVRDLSHGH